MSLYTLGFNHPTAPVEMRERVAFQPDALGHALRDLLARPRVKEAAILSTCNRTEVYVHGTEPRPVVRWLEEFHRVPADSLPPYIYTLPRERAVSHAFRVASGLDSMVLGEPQILGQMKQAVRHAESAGTLGLVLNRLFQRTFAVAKDVRTSTDIGSASISMAAAVGQARRADLPVAVRAAAAADRRRRDDRARPPRISPRSKPQSITIANRTLERGKQLAARFGADAITLNELPERLPEFDIVVTCTASSLPILGKGLLERVVKARRHTPMFIVDLAVPRDVEPEAARPRRRVPLQRRRPVEHRQGQPADPPRVGGAGRADDRRRRRRASCAGSRAARSCRRSPRCTATTTRCAPPSSSARASCSLGRRRPSR